MKISTLKNKCVKVRKVNKFTVVTILLSVIQTLQNVQYFFGNDFQYSDILNRSFSISESENNETKLIQKYNDKK